MICFILLNSSLANSQILLPSDIFIVEGPKAKFYLTQGFKPNEFYIKNSDGTIQGLIKMIGQGEMKGKNMMLHINVNCKLSIFRTSEFSINIDLPYSEWKKPVESTIYQIITSEMCKQYLKN